MISSSARRDPAALSACRIDSRSCGDAPIEFIALTTSARLAPPLTIKTLPGSFLISMVGFDTTTVLPFDRGAGWLASLFGEMVIDRLPCEMAHASRVTDWFITTDPVRAFMMTLALATAGLTSRPSRMPRKATRWSDEDGDI